MTPRQTRFAQVLAWLADAGPEDLADLRREIETETQEFLLAEEEHRVHLAGLRRLELILAERCGEDVPAWAANPSSGMVHLPPGVSLTTTPEWKQLTQLAVDEFVDSCRQDAGESGLPVSVSPEVSQEPAADSTPSAVDFTDKSNTNNDSWTESAELLASREFGIDEREPPPDDDDARSVEERLRDTLRKLGSRSARQLGGILGIEKSVVLDTLKQGKWFRLCSGDYADLPEVNRPWWLSKAGKAS